MSYRRFEDLPVWQAAIKFNGDVEDLCEHRVFKRRWYLVDQLQRAALSISNNIAEGFESGTNRQLIAYLFRSKASAGECRSMFASMRNKQRYTAIWDRLDELRIDVLKISAQLRNWARQLQENEIAGLRYHNEKMDRSD